MQNEDVRSALQVAMGQAQKRAHEISRGPGGREMALVITKLQEAMHWLGDCDSALHIASFEVKE